MPQVDTQLTERGGRAAPGTVQAMIERAAGCNYRFACFELQPYERRLLAAGEPAAVGPHAFDLLIALVAHAGRLVTKEELLERVWPNLVVEENNLDKQVSNLRRILGADAIETVRGQGYRFTLPAMRVEVAPPALAAKSRRTNLPASLTSFVGRQREIAEIKRLLPDSRLLTLVGIGGIGKTRLALQAAAEVLDAYRDGVWFVDLAPLNDPALVASTLAQVLGVREAAGIPLVEALCAQLNGRQLWLVLDNCEHLLEACALLADAVLRSAAEAAIIATSREPFHIAGEQTYPLSALSLPDPSASAEEVGRSEAVQLFVERARRHQPDFALTAARARAVAELCIHLDGIPLALELAAARVRSLSIEQINARLDDRFKLLTDGNRTALPRQQTLRGTLDWSHALLSEHERVLLRRLAIFVGGFTLVAAESVASDERIDQSTVIELLSQLVERSLVVADTNAARARYRLLETTRAYGLEKLAEAGELDAIKRRHAQAMLTLLEQTYDAYWQQADDHVYIVLVLASDLDNVRAAINWSIGNNATLAVRLAGEARALFLFAGQLHETRALSDRIEPLITDATATDAAAWFWVMRALALYAEARERSAAAALKAIELFRKGGDPRKRVVPLLGAITMMPLPLEIKERLLVELRQAIPPHWPAYRKTLSLAEAEAALAWLRGDRLAARDAYLKAVTTMQSTPGLRAWHGELLIYLVGMEQVLGLLDDALKHAREASELERKSGPSELLYRLLSLAGVLIERGDLSDARETLVEAVVLSRRTGWRRIEVIARRFVCLAAREGRMADAARLLGYLRQLDISLDPFAQASEAHMQSLGEVRTAAALSPDELARLMAEGSTLDEAAVCERGLSEPLVAANGQ